MNYKTIFSGVVGSTSYGTSTPTSDIDTKFIYCQHPNELLGFGYTEQLNIDKDNVGYEVRRILELLATGNPNINELLWLPEDCIKERSTAFDILVANRDKFVTKMCYNAYSQYAYQQIKKASSLSKKSRLEKGAVAKKELLDFVYFIKEGRTVPVKQYLQQERLKEEFCGLINLEHAKNLYALYYDYPSHYDMEGKRANYQSLNYKGICDSNSHMVKLSHVEKGQKPIGIVSVNHEGYSTYAKEKKEYDMWLENRNINRFVEDTTHGQFIDAKNMLHNRRLLDMAKEIATEGKIIVKRPNTDYLLKIKRGEVNLQQLIEDSERDIEALKPLYEQSNLSESVDPVFLNELLLEIRNAVKF